MTLCHKDSLCIIMTLKRILDILYVLCLECVYETEDEDTEGF